MLGRVDQLNISEIFVSLQGESSHAGWPCVLVRTAGCPLRCSFCDTGYACEDGERMSAEQVMARVAEYGTRRVELTGGEPLFQAASLDLLRRLCEADYTVLLETNGAMDITPVDPRVHIVMDVKCPSSGMTDRMRWENLALLKAKDEVKFVVGDRADYEFARGLIREHDLPARCTVLLSAVHGKLDAAEVAEWMLEDQLEVRFQLQLHRLLWPDETSGR